MARTVEGVRRIALAYRVAILGLALGAAVAGAWGAAPAGLALALVALALMRLDLVTGVSAWWEGWEPAAAVGTALAPVAAALGGVAATVASAGLGEYRAHEVSHEALVDAHLDETGALFERTSVRTVVVGSPSARVLRAGRRRWICVGRGTPDVPDVERGRVALRLAGDDAAGGVRDGVIVLGTVLALALVDLGRTGTAVGIAGASIVIEGGVRGWAAWRAGELAARACGAGGRVAVATALVSGGRRGPVRWVNRARARRVMVAASAAERAELAARWAALGEARG